MSPKLFGIVLVGTFLFSGSRCLANVITFDDLPQDCSGNAIPDGYRGLDWFVFGHDNATAVGCYPSGLATVLTSFPNVAFGNDGASITSSTPFELLSGYFAAVWNDGLDVEITAKLGSSVVGTESLTLNTTAKVFEMFNFGPVTELDFSSSGGTPSPTLILGGGTQFAVDNLTVDFVPEASSFKMSVVVLMALSANCIFGRARRL